MSYSRQQLIADLDAELTIDEGTRLRLYYDSRGVPTIGRGRNLRDVGISVAECDMLTADDIDAAETALDAHVSWWRALPEGPARVIVNQAISERRPIHSYGARAADVADAFDQLWKRLRKTTKG